MRTFIYLTFWDCLVSEEFSRLDEVERIAADFFTWNVRNHPVRATRIGIFDNAGDLEDFSSSSIERERIFLTSLLRRCESAESNCTSQNQLYDLQLIKSATQSWIFRTDRLKELERDPDYLSLLFRSIFFVLEQPRLTDLAKAHLISARLARVPRYLEIAKLNLKDPDLVLLRYAITNTTALLSFISRIAKEASKWGLQEHSLQLLQQRISQSTKSLTFYRKFLSTLTSVSTRHQVDDQDFELLLKLRGVPFSTSEILKMAFERIDICRQTLTEIAKDFNQDVSWENIALPSRMASPSEASREYFETILRTRNFMLRSHFMTLPE